MAFLQRFLPRSDRQGHLLSPHSSSAKGSVLKKLCNRCAALDLRDRETVGKFVAICDLGCMEAGTMHPQCSFCSFLCSIRTSVSSEDNHEQLTLFYVTFPDPYALAYIPGFMIIKGSFPIGRMLNTYSINKCNFRSCLAAFTKGPSKQSKNSVKIIREDRIDWTQVRTWHEFCMTECRCRNYYRPWPSQFRLINCKDRIVIESDRPCQFVALSYVWGKSGANAKSTEGLDAGRLPKLLPQTIEDAMAITMRLGMKYLWVDQYCIDQSNHTHKKSQVQQMHSIYKAAEMTIVAACGEDSNYGLPGVNRKQRIPQARYGNGKESLVSQQLGLSNVQSKWHTRGWTYQEEYFSLRCLFVTDHQIYYRCPFSEETESMQKSTYSHFTGSPVYDDNVSIDRIGYHLYHYSRRSLSYPDDAINAFSGLLKNWGEKNPPLYHYYGIVATTLGHTYTDDSDDTRTIHHTAWEEGFVQHLCWTNAECGNRRPKFPSWSWAGWEVPIAKTCEKAYYQHGQDSGLQVRVLLEQADDKMAQKEFWKDLIAVQSENEFTMFIQLKCWVVSLKLVTEQSIQNRTATHKASFRDRDVEVCIPARILQAESIYNYAKSAKGDAILGILVGLSKDKHFFMIIVENKGTHFERIGSLNSQQPDDDQPHQPISRYSRELIFKQRIWRQVRLG